MCGRNSSFKLEMFAGGLAPSFFKFIFVCFFCLKLRYNTVWLGMPNWLGSQSDNEDLVNLFHAENHGGETILIREPSDRSEHTTGSCDSTFLNREVSDRSVHTISSNDSTSSMPTSITMTTISADNGEETEVTTFAFNESFFSS